MRYNNVVGKQSQDIALGVDGGITKDQGAGDQGLMFGYASNETEVLMPAPITYAHRLVRKQAEVRKSGQIDFLGPDAKSQLTLAYDTEGSPCGLEAIVLSTQHAEGIEQKVIEEAVVEEIIKPTLPSEWFSKRTKIFVNPTGNFVIGGPVGDCGLTGRKIIVYMQVWQDTEEALSPGKIPQKLTEVRLMLVDTSQKILLLDL